MRLLSPAATHVCSRPRLKRGRTMFWFLLHCNTAQQHRYTKHIAEHFPATEIYYPQYGRLSRPHGMRRPISIPTPVYPGYIFARPDSATHPRSLVSTHPRAYYVRFGPNIALVPNDIIDKLRIMESLNQLVTEKTAANPYKPGKRVIIHTPVADIQAIIVHLIGHNRVLVDTNFCQITVPLAKITVR